MMHHPFRKSDTNNSAEHFLIFEKRWLKIMPIELKPASVNDKGELEFEKVVVVVKKDKTMEVIPEADYKEVNV